MKKERALRLRRARIAAGYTQRVAAQRLNKSLHTYRAWEQGRTEPSAIEDMVAISDLFGLSLDYWLRGVPNITDSFESLAPGLRDAVVNLIEQMSG